ncbi:four helix bundle protein [Thauera aromatica]|uniref:bAvd-like domain-containing protein n=1 Tax=Thauera aromatica K172 TaxID=44139 RepID=A0A2R4BP62_THAAR|nr:four helix bundle protein [Thauera aromatica]AVR89014.1 hypothetical protein Tharo_2111 [Thauera aromatica K172]
MSTNTTNPQAAIHHKCRELILLLNVNLNHFPRHEKYGLCQEIRQAVYDVLAGIVECQKRYHNKTSLSKLDVRHEQLRTFVNLAFELGYFEFEHHKRARSAAESLRRYTAVSVLINELGAMIGGWIRSLRASPQAE